MNRRQFLKRSSASLLALAAATYVPSIPEAVDTRRGVMRIVGAKEHNLRNLTLDIPRDCFIVLTGLPAAGDGRTWQAWTLADGQPVSAGLMTPDADGLAVLADVARTPGTSVVALTVEPAGGSEAPTTQPVVVGQLGAPLALGGRPVALRP